MNNFLNVRNIPQGIKNAYIYVMTLLEFSEKFPDEQSSRTHLKLVRHKTGFVCKKCLRSTHYWLQNKEQYQCKSCSTRTTLRSGALIIRITPPIFDERKGKAYANVLDIYSDWLIELPIYKKLECN